MKAELGVVGLGVMGKSLALNLARKGNAVSVFSTRAEELRAFERDPRTLGLPLAYPKSLPKFITQIQRPRKIWVMVKAGLPTDQLLDRLFSGLNRGDAVLEGGNSHFTETESRLLRAKAKGIHFLGCGVSGGEEGALLGPSLMAGGDREAWRAFAPLLKVASASTELGPCAAFLGRGSAGHFVKMVHNGIEYALMQSLAEAYQVLERVFGLPQAEMAGLFERWNQGSLNSYLAEISVTVLRKRDGDGAELLPRILDRSQQKGTGKWVCQAALDLGLPVPTISAALEARYLSALKSQRMRLGALRTVAAAKAGETLVQDLEVTVWLAWQAAFAQGLHLLHIASQQRSYGLRMSEVLRVWSGGCIIRAGILKALRQLYLRRPSLENPLFEPSYFSALVQALPAGLRACSTLRQAGLALPALNASLDYLLGISTARLPANFIQVQRDLFGAHTYERLDKKGSFHTSW